MTRRTLGQRLAIRITVATAISLAVVAAIGIGGWAITERGEEDFRDELLEQLIPVVAIAVVGIASSVVVARWLTRRATARIDHVIATATQVTAHDLSARLPVSADGDELDELSAALNLMLARIERGVGAQRQFAADASHELRTPLTAALSALEVARRRPRTADEWTGHADRAIGELTRMSTVIDALLQLARADAGLGAHRPVDVAALVERVCDALAAHAEVAIVAKVAAALAVSANAAALEIAISNLLANAVTHSPAGAEVTITGARHGDRVRIDVTDRGPGVAPADRTRIFEPFTRVAAARADRVAHGAGLGLGLAIARRIAEAHGGSLAVDDAPDGGARFSLWLPAPG